MPRKLLFENVTCSRCGGSGKFSYCSMYGSTCFKCHGDGVVLTKKGMAANSWLNAKRKKKGSEFAVGDWILVEGIPGFSASKWATVTEVSGTGNDHKMEVAFKAGGSETLNGFGDFEMKTFLGKEKETALKMAAKAFEATLTKAGTVRKKATKAAAAAAAGKEKEDEESMGALQLAS